MLLSMIVVTRLNLVLVLYRLTYRAGTGMATPRLGLVVEDKPTELSYNNIII